MGAWLSWLFTPSSKILTINDRRFIIKKLLGEGGKSFVYLIEDPKNKQLFACKKMLCQTSEQLQGAQHEVDIMKEFKHDNILKLIDFQLRESPSSKGDKEMLILMPFFRNGTLLNILHKNRLSGKEDTNWNEMNILVLFSGICKAVREFHMHEPPFAHYDLKPGNVLLSDDGHPVLLDFGSVNIARHNIKSRQEALQLQEFADEQCTPLYRAPELFNIESNAEIDERADIWSLGCTLYALAFNESPFEKESENGSIALAVQSGKLEFPESSKRFTNEFLHLIRWMVNVDHKGRPFLHDVIERVDTIIHSASVTIDMP